MKHMSKTLLRWILPVLLLMMISITSLADEKAGKPSTVPEIRPGIPAGYLHPRSRPDKLSLAYPPPAEGSAAQAMDEEINKKALKLRGTPRWDLATEDANLHFPEAAGTFSCALNAPITENDTPRLYMLLRRVMVDAGYATYRSKMKFKRPRPFLVNNEPICTPEAKEGLRNNGSYPSGHTAIGWTWALILCEISPEQSIDILKRGRAFGESRMVCNVHWQTDVIEGRFMGAAIVACLHADPTFQTDLEAAKAELAAVRAKGLKQPTRDCEAETKALSQPLADY